LKNRKSLSDHEKEVIDSQINSSQKDTKRFQSRASSVQASDLKGNRVIEEGANTKQFRFQQANNLQEGNDEPCFFTIGGNKKKKLDVGKKAYEAAINMIQDTQD